MVPGAASQMPRRNDGRRRFAATPATSSNAPSRKMVSTAGICNRLCRYLPLCMLTVPCASVAKPSIVKSWNMTQRNVSRNRAKLTSRLRRSRGASGSWAMLFWRYNAPRQTARHMTISPNATLKGSATASSPCQAHVQRLMTGAAMLPTAFLSMTNCEPVKKVPTAVPMSSGARQPFSVRKMRNDVLPMRLPALFWNS